MNSAQRSTTLLAGLMLVAISPLARSQNTPVSVGDLVEYVSGLGPTLGEVVVGPDPSNYVLLLIPTGEQVPVNVGKLRLVQKAGTPNAPSKVGEAVSWVDANVSQKGNVVKINGNWCQVKSSSATTIGWIECKALRTAAQAAAAASADKAAPAANAASPKVNVPKLQGNWENADGSMKLEFQSANKCYISFGPMTGACTYKQSAKGVTVNFDGEDLALAANDDGSLSGDPDAMIPIRLKRK